jgi:hypothetical protein
MRKKQRYGGLSPRHVRLIRDYVTKLYEGSQQESTAAIFVWTYLLLDCDESAVKSAKVAGLGKSTVNALKAGLAVLKRKRVGRVWDVNPEQSFKTIGITASV